MSAGDAVWEVMRWQSTGPNSGMGSGPAVRVVGWAAAGRVARKWMARGPDYYVSISRAVEPFAAARGIYQHEPDWLCLTSINGSLDAPEHIAAGSMKRFFVEGGPVENEMWAPSIVSRGFWL